MSTYPPVSTPTVTELVAILSSSDSGVRPEAVKPLIVHLPRPTWWLRLLLLLALCLLGVFALYGVLAAQMLSDVELLALLKHKAAPIIHPVLPAANLLLDEHSFATALEQQPDETGRLHLARTSLLLSVGRKSEAAEEFAATAKTVTGLPPAQRLRWAELLFDLDRHEEAHAILHTVVATGMNEDQRTRIAALAGRCLFAERPTPVE